MQLPIRDQSEQATAPFVLLPGEGKASQMSSARAVRAPGCGQEARSAPWSVMLGSHAPRLRPFGIQDYVVQVHDQGRGRYPHAQWPAGPGPMRPPPALHKDTVLGFRVHRMLKAEFLQAAQVTVTTLPGLTARQGHWGRRGSSERTRPEKDGLRKQNGGVRRAGAKREMGRGRQGLLWLRGRGGQRKGLGRGAEGRVLPWWLKWRGGGAVGCLEGGVAELRRDWAWPAGSGWAKSRPGLQEEGLVKGVAASGKKPSCHFRRR